MTPERIQQRRTRGWRKPENTLGVARPSRWGNPFRVTYSSVIGPGWFELRALPIGARLRVADAYVLYSSHSGRSTAVSQSIDLFRTLAKVTLRDRPEEFEKWIAPLRGKNLMCFCPLDQPCHADVLLELANGRTPA